MSEIISLISGGIIGGFIGAFLGGFAKFFWEHWLPSRLTWKREQSIQRTKLLSQFRDPAIRAISEMQGRIFAILRDLKFAGNYYYLKQENNEEYYILSTSFLIAQFFAWVEVLRRKVAMLDYSELVLKLERSTQSFSHGGRGFQIYKLEQREIGERMLIEFSNSDQQCLGYAQFVELLKNKGIPTCMKQLKLKVQYLMDHPISQAVRLVSIQHSLIELIEFIDPDSHWIPRSRRTKIDIHILLKKMFDGNEINEDAYHSLLEESKNAGILLENAS